MLFRSIREEYDEDGLCRYFSDKEVSILSDGETVRVDYWNYGWLSNDKTAMIFHFGDGEDGITFNGDNYSFSLSQDLIYEVWCSLWDRYGMEFLSE